MKKKDLELYIHIPFCAQKCRYCDFLSYSAAPKVREAYVKALLSEIIASAQEYSRYHVRSIFIGGGTPSLLPGKAIETIMQTLYDSFPINTDAEITIEANPGTLDTEKLQAYLRSGINRLSLGLQSADDDELQLLGRIHTYEQFCESYTQARQMGFTNINVDLMNALPMQTRERFQMTLSKVLTQNPPPEHISVYGLMLEEETPFWTAFQEGTLPPLPEEDVECAMLDDTIRNLRQHGYHRYEISNYAKEGKECRHNNGYWERYPYAGFGLGAASLIGNTRYSNTKDPNRYLLCANQPNLIRENIQPLTKQEQIEETLFLGLRCSSGITSGAFQEEFGVTLDHLYAAVIERNKKEELIETIPLTPSEYRIRLTPKGMQLSNIVLAQFLLSSLKS
jgi:oxygen-independent coproporphyrinogen-3 oxidase